MRDAAELIRTFADADLAGALPGANDRGLPGTSTVIMPGLSGLGTVEWYNGAMSHIMDLARSNATELQYDPQRWRIKPGADHS